MIWLRMKQDTPVWRSVTRDPRRIGLYTVRTNLIPPETKVPELRFCFIQIFVVDFEKHMYNAIEHIIVVPGHPRSLISVQIEKALQ